MAASALADSPLTLASQALEVSPIAKRKILSPLYLERLSAHAEEGRQVLAVEYLTPPAGRMISVLYSRILSRITAGLTFLLTQRFSTGSYTKEVSSPSLALIGPLPCCGEPPSRRKIRPSHELEATGRTAEHGGPSAEHC